MKITRRQFVKTNLLSGAASMLPLAAAGAESPAAALENRNLRYARLDEILSQANISPDDRVIMKLDIEGMEPEAIAGARSFISRQKNLRVIYEHFKEDNYRNDKALLAVCDFSFENLDEVNRFAIKKA